MNWIKRAWRGEEKLWKVFWLYGVLLGIALQIITFGVLPAISPLLMIIGLCLYIAYFIWLLVSEWRCAFNAGWRVWGYIVRGLIILFPVSLLLGGVLTMQDLIHRAECRKEVKDIAIQQGITPEQYMQQHPDAIGVCFAAKQKGKTTQ